MKIKIIQIVLLIGIAILAYFVWETIQTPVRFNKEKDSRSEVVIQNLKDIRSVQQMYKALNDTFTPSFDTLIKFMTEGQIPVVNIIFDPSDTTLTKTINDTIAFVSVADSLFGSRNGFVINDIQYIPFSQGVKFDLDAGSISKGGVMVPVFMAMAKKEDYLKGMDKALIRNPSVKDLIVGSMSEPSTDGNWE
ncbi:MAG: hypothetical protein B6D64_04220 [Bacteroidetes bacterium 4484_276]|nr:MAG: hypothetical protein B6D64_04220 [Bacteroidetes bacterium 4484_276]OYT13948.1 MAG: hypothetical protein B6I19_02470 [Bacteroidetes bacterium 4572_114]